jgi:GxxExxY protein
VYERALMFEMKHRGLNLQNQVAFDVLYKGANLGIQQRIDILVNDQVVIEIKSVERLLPVHHKQLISYLKLMDKPLGILVNFNTHVITDSIIRIANDPNHPELKARAGNDFQNINQ